jgi:selenocysteine lyase/cysteine desulfurase
MKRLGLASTTRASFYVYNDRQEVERLAEVIAGIRKFFMA